MKTISPVFASSMFTYNPTTKAYSAEASDLGREPFGRLYDDACDRGLTLTSPHPAGTATFCLDENATVRDRDNDVVNWVLRPTFETLRRIPALEGVTVVVFND